MGYIALFNPPQFASFARLPSIPGIIQVNTMRAGNDTQTASIPPYGIKIEGDLQKFADMVKAITVPGGITSVIVTVTANVIKVIAQQAADQADDLRVIEQGAQLLTLVNKGNDR